MKNKNERKNIKNISNIKVIKNKYAIVYTHEILNHWIYFINGPKCEKMQIFRISLYPEGPSQDQFTGVQSFVAGRERGKIWTSFTLQLIL